MALSSASPLLVCPPWGASSEGLPAGIWGEKIVVSLGGFLQGKIEISSLGERCCCLQCWLCPRTVVVLTLYGS